METELRELLQERAEEMRIDPEIPRTVLRRARRRRAGIVLAAGAVAAGMVAAAFVGGRALVAMSVDPDRRDPGQVGPAVEWRGIWPQDSREEAEAAQAAADAGDPSHTWQLDPREVIERYAFDVLGWERVFFVQSVPREVSPDQAPVEDINIGDCNTVGLEECPHEAEVTVDRLVRRDVTGIWSVARVHVRGASGPTAITEEEVRDAVSRFMRARIAGMGAEDLLSPQARGQYQLHEGGLFLHAPTSNPPYDRFEIQRTTQEYPTLWFVEVRIYEELTGEAQTGSFLEHLWVGGPVDGESREVLIQAAFRPEPPPAAAGPAEASFRQVVQAFLDARVAGAGAEGYLSDEALEAYRDHRGGLHLYGEEDEVGLGGSYGNTWIESVTVYEDGAEVVVHLQVSWLGDSPPSWVVEFLSVGPADTHEGRFSNQVVFEAERKES